MKRAAELQEARSRIVEAAARSAVCVSRVEMVGCVMRSGMRSMQLERAREAYERSALFQEEVQAAAVRATARRAVAIEVLLNRLTLRRVAAFGPRHGKRDLTFRLLEWRVATTATERLVRPLWRAWNATDRRVMVVRVPQDEVSLKIAADLARGGGDAQDSAKVKCALRKRFVITVRQDPALGTILLVAERACHPLEREEVPIAPAEIQDIVKAKGRSELARQYCALGPVSAFGTQTVMSMCEWNRRRRALQKNDESCQSSRFVSTDDLMKPKVLVRRTLANGARARLAVAKEVADVLCSELHLDVFTGVLRVGRIMFSRRRKALLRRLHFGDSDKEAGGLDGGAYNGEERNQIPDQPDEWSHTVVFARPCGRWWLDAWVAKRSFQRGALVLHFYLRPIWKS